METEELVYQDLSTFFLSHRENYFEYIDTFRKQIPTFENLLYWLKDQPGQEYHKLLIKLVLNYSPLLERCYQQSITAIFVEDCITDYVQAFSDPYELAMVAYSTFWSIGNWVKAEKYISMAVDYSKYRSLVDQANALKCKGSLQINKGEFQQALITLHKAKKIFRELGDIAGENSVSMEEAAYYLDMGDFTTAEKIYLEVAEIEKMSQKYMSNHSLLMIGIVTRRLGRNEEAIPYLMELLNRAKNENSINDLAVAKHHLAWVYFNRHEFLLAQQTALESQKLFHDIDDRRGESDVDEQLGEIAVATGNPKVGRFYYECAANIRKQLNNKQGLASVQRRLSRLYFQDSNIIKGFYYLFQCSFLYLQNKMLTKNRLSRGFREVFLKRNIASYPR